MTANNRRNASARATLASAALAAATVCLAGDGPWPQWQGPRRDNLSTETGLLREWPEGGPKLIWSAAGCGKGYSSVAVSDDLIYTAGTADDETFVIAYDLDGALRWHASNGKRWEAGARMVWAKGYDGARATPTVNDGLVYHLNEMGRLTAFDAQDGSVLWFVDLTSRFSANCPDYGYSESLLVDGGRLICTPGGKGGYMAALDKKTGAVVWTNTDIDSPAAFSSPILVEDLGVRQIVTLTEGFVIGVEADTGRLLWKHPFTNKRENNIPTPIYHSGCVFATTGYGTGSVLLKLAVEGTNVLASPVWANAELDNVHGGVVLIDGCVYGAAHNKPAWLCLDVETGRRRYRDESLGMGSLTAAEGMLYCLAERGTMALVRCTPERFDLVSRFDVPRGGEGMFWARPVVCGGRLYIRHADRLYAYTIMAE